MRLSEFANSRCRFDECLGLESTVELLAVTRLALERTETATSAFTLVFCKEGARLGYHAIREVLVAYEHRALHWLAAPRRSRPRCVQKCRSEFW